MNTATNEDLEQAAASLRRESLETLERIKPSDHPAIKESLVAASVHIADMAERIEEAAMQRNKIIESADEMSAGLFVALIAVANQYMESIGGGAASLDSMLVAIRENLS